VTVDPELGTVVWPDGADIDPDVLYGRFEPEWAEAGYSDDIALGSKHGWSGRVAEPRPTPAYDVASREFTVVIHRDAHDIFVASVPELPGCEARARSRDELTQRVREAIRHAVKTHGEPTARVEFVGVQVVEVPI
jgi:predicted RNase H-like HicB family nuclease